MAHTIIEGDKFQDLQGTLTSWRPRRATGVVLFQVEKPKNQENQWSSSSLKTNRLKTQKKAMFKFESKGRKEMISSSNAFKQMEFSLTWGMVSLSLVLIRTSTDWMRSIHNRENNLLSSAYPFNC